MASTAILVNLALSIIVTALVGGIAYLVPARLDRGVSPYARSHSSGSTELELSSPARDEQRAA